MLLISIDLLFYLQLQTVIVDGRGATNAPRHSQVPMKKTITQTKEAEEHELSFQYPLVLGM
jgi:hypothetical protein